MFSNSGLGAWMGNILGEFMEDSSFAITWVANIPLFLLSLL